MKTTKIIDGKKVILDLETQRTNDSDEHSKDIDFWALGDDGNEYEGSAMIDIFSYEVKEIYEINKIEL